MVNISTMGMHYIRMQLLKWKLIYMHSIVILCKLKQSFLGWLSRPDICNRLSVINLQPGDVIMAATSLAEVAAFGTRKTRTKCIRTI